MILKKEINIIELFLSSGVTRAGQMGNCGVGVDETDYENTHKLTPTPHLPTSRTADRWKFISV